MIEAKAFTNHHSVFAVAAFAGLLLAGGCASVTT